MNNIKELQITISGKVASGKSTMALLLEKFLTEKGFKNVELVFDDEIHDYRNEEYFRTVFNKHFSELEESLIKTNTKITIKQVLTKL
jgi:pantothenate kinase-related protein Tda10